jgi:hypothetical protein
VTLTFTNPAIIQQNFSIIDEDVLTLSLIPNES